MNTRPILSTVAVSLLLIVGQTPAKAADLVVGTEQSIPFTGTYEEFTIPETNPPAFLHLTVFGGDGGDAYAGQNLQCFARGGQGGTAEGIFRVGYGLNELDPGGTIRFIVGGEGNTDEDRKGGGVGGGGGAPIAAAGGGGGSGVIYRAPGNSSNACGADWIVLVAAGGGGGATQGAGIGCPNGHDGSSARTGECGRDGAGSTGGDGGCNGQEGENGGSNGGKGGGGAGAFGESGSSGAAGRGCPTGGNGGIYDDLFGADGGWGFGGGGHASGSHSGGGGGYSGGGGGGGTFVHEGGGGGSYVSLWGINRRTESSNGDRSDGEALYLAIYGNESCSSSTDCNANGVPDDCDLDSIGRLNNFVNGVGAYSLNGSAVLENGNVRLTPVNTNQNGSIIFEPVTDDAIDSFSVEFDYKMGEGSGADGMSFVLIDADLTGDDLQPGEGGADQPLVVSLDTYDGDAAGGNHAELLSFGNSIARVQVPHTLDNDKWQHASIAFTNGTLTLSLRDASLNESLIFDEVAVPGFNPIRARYGLGARTGGSTNTHRVDSIRFKIDRPNDCDANDMPDDCDPDNDGDGTPDACEDDDGDGVANFEDECPGFDDNVDVDGDGVADDCDICPLDSADDSDGDGVCDSDDLCAGFDDNSDADDDSVPDGCDVCPGSDDGLDGDNDGFPDGCDGCPNGLNAWNQTQDSYHATIADAIDASMSGDVIELGACVFIERGLNLNDKDITLRGQGIDVTIIDGDGVAGRILNLSNGDESTVEDLTVRNGLAGVPAGGAALRVRSSSNALFRRCRFENNDGADGLHGAIYLIGNSATTFDACVFEGNRSDEVSSVAGLVQDGTSARFVNCRFRANLGLASNVIRAQGGTIEAINCTFAETANQRPLWPHAGATVSATNCVFDAMSVPAPNRITLSYSLFPGGAGDNIDGVPTFVDATNGDFSLAAGSLGIDAADRDAYVAVGGDATDLNGDPRTHDDTGITDTGLGSPAYLDMGALEFQGTTECGSGGDFGNNGTVDLDDYRRFGSCVNGPIGGLGANCSCFDLDSDGDVDVRDFAEFQLSFTGSN